MVAPATRTTDKVACTTSRALRAKEDRSLVPRPHPRSASAGAVRVASHAGAAPKMIPVTSAKPKANASTRSEEHTSELQSQSNLVCRLLLEKKKIYLLSRAATNPRFECSSDDVRITDSS